MYKYLKFFLKSSRTSFSKSHVSRRFQGRSPRRKYVVCGGKLGSNCSATTQLNTVGGWTATTGDVQLHTGWKLLTLRADCNLHLCVLQVMCEWHIPGKKMGCISPVWAIFLVRGIPIFVHQVQQKLDLPHAATVTHEGLWYSPTKYVIILVHLPSKVPPTQLMVD